MKLKDYTVEELETMGYDEIANLVLSESNKKMKLIDLFGKVNLALGREADSDLDHITDFFELLSTNKKFVMLDNGYWDLQTKHKSQVVIEDDDEDFADMDEVEESSSEDVEEEEENASNEDIFYEGDDQDTITDDDDDLADLMVVGEEEEEVN
jgi:DNA-directed RNA polymerase delta subunit